MVQNVGGSHGVGPGHQHPGERSDDANPAIAKDEYWIRSAFWPQQYPRDSFWFYWLGDVAQNTARWFDDQQLPEGSVLVVTFGLARGCSPIAPAVRDSQRFRLLRQAQPAVGGGVRYILVPRPTGFGSSDAVNVRYPNPLGFGGRYRRPRGQGGKAALPTRLLESGLI